MMSGVAGWRRASALRAARREPKTADPGCFANPRIVGDCCQREAYTGRVVFRWDPNKAAANRKKHGVDFHEAATVLDDALSTTFPDSDHSGVERRFLTIGISSRRRLLVVAHTEDGEVIRIISARRATPRERRFYEEG